MNQPSIQQQAEELTNACVQKLVMKILSMQTVIDSGPLRDIILQELSMEQLMADKLRLDWMTTHSIDTDGRPYVTITRQDIDDGMAGVE